MKLTWERFILGFVIAFLIVMLIHTCNEKQNQSTIFNNNLKASQDTLVHTRNKLGQETSTISSLSGSVSELKQFLSSSRDSIKNLNSLLTKNSVSAAIIKDNTSGKVSVPTVVIAAKSDDKKPVDTSTFCKTYTGQVASKWINIDVTANCDSTHFTYDIHNEYDFKQEYVKTGGFFSKKKLVASIKNLNPYTTTTELYTFNITTKKTNKLLIFTVGLGVGIAGAIYLLK